MLKNVRIWFQKMNSAKYISHLDLAGCMSRALKMSGLPIWYTEGYNPRVYMTFAMPLSLGISGEMECMDIRLTDEVSFVQVRERLNRGLPRDLAVTEAAEPDRKFDEIAWADYLLRFEETTDLKARLETLLGRETVTVAKHTKKGNIEFDIKPFFAQCKMSGGEAGTLQMEIMLPSSVQGSVNPFLLLEALKTYENLEPYCQITRRALLTKDFCKFR